MGLAYGVCQKIIATDMMLYFAGDVLWRMFCIRQKDIGSTGKPGL
jgi:hypothetical protein